MTSLWRGLRRARQPRDMDEETFPVRIGHGVPLMMSRSNLLGNIRGIAPYGRPHVSRVLSNIGVYEDFVAAFRHFGLDHLIVDVQPEEIDDEMRARRERGAPPTGRRLPHMMERDRDFADAMIDVYERRVEAAASFLEGREARPPAGA